MPSLPVRLYRTHSKKLDREEIVRGMDAEQVAVRFVPQEISGERVALTPRSGDHLISGLPQTLDTCQSTE
jgi:hypothetical protein